MKHDTLQPDKINGTIKLLHRRIEERFPDSGLLNICGNVMKLAQNMETRATWIARPLIWLRVLTWAVVAALIVFAISPVVWVIWFQPAVDEVSINVADVIQLMEAGINDVVLIGAAIFFLLTFETRYKRKRALEAMHEIRSIAHVIDMHQLTKDPHRIMNADQYCSTSLSPKTEMTRFELHRYLDYCSEMLALVGKIAAVYVQEFDDGVAMATASEIETLTTGLSQKIWQKIAILSDVENLEAVVISKAEKE
jgi:hypothetical protein